MGMGHVTGCGSRNCTYRLFGNLSHTRGNVYVESFLACPSTTRRQAHLFHEVGGCVGILVVNDEIIGRRELGSEILGHWIP